MASVSDLSSQFTSQKIADAKSAAKADKASQTGTNPNAELDKDAFMKLLLTELQYQDPTSPMDTEKMLTQTSQLATLEMQQNTNTTMQELATQLKSSASMYALGSLGKMASTGVNSVEISDAAKEANLPLYFSTAAKSGAVEISNSSGQVVRTISFDELSSGVQNFAWDGKNDAGEQVSNGSYSVQASYIDADNNKHTTELGKYPVEAVKFVDGKAQVRIAGEYISTDKIAEFYEA